MECMTGAVIPVALMDGYLQSMLGFPAWLGRQSSRSKRLRLSTTLLHHMDGRVTAGHASLVQDYLPALADALARPLVEEQDKGAPRYPTDDKAGGQGAAWCRVRDVLSYYALSREDMDSVMELATWGKRDRLAGVLPKVRLPSVPVPQEAEVGLGGQTKAALTRLLNAADGSGLRLPYAADVKGLKKRKAAAAAAGSEDAEEGEEEAEDDIDPEAFKVPPPASSSQPNGPCNCLKKVAKKKKTEAGATKGRKKK